MENPYTLMLLDGVPLSEGQTDKGSQEDDGATHSPVWQQPQSHSDQREKQSSFDQQQPLHCGEAQELLAAAHLCSPVLASHRLCARQEFSYNLQS